MNLLSYILGACLCMYCTLAAVAFLNRSKNAPYREAFGWVCTLCAVQVICDILVKEHPSLPIISEYPFIMLKETSIIPLCAMEVFCLYNQDIATCPWKRRWMAVAICEIPFILFALVMWATGWEAMRWIICGYAIVLMILWVIRDSRKVSDYSYILSFTPDSNNRSINWVGWIFVSYMLLFCFYVVSVTCRFKYIWEIYLLCSMVNFYVHAYFIMKQRPENHKSMEEVRMAFQKQQERFDMEIQQKSMEMENAAKEIKENAEKLKRKVDMKEYMDTMMLEHPQFANRLRAATDNRLTSHDIFLCMLVYDGKKATSVAKHLGIGSRSVEVARSRLRKKFNLNAGENLHAFICNVVDDHNE